MFLSSKTSRLPRGPPSLQLIGYRGTFPRVKRPEPDVNHSYPFSGEVNEWSYTSPTSRHLFGGDSFKVVFIRLLGAGYFQLSLVLNNDKVTWNFLMMKFNILFAHLSVTFLLKLRGQRKNERFNLTQFGAEPASEWKD